MANVVSTLGMPGEGLASQASAPGLPAEGVGAFKQTNSKLPIEGLFSQTRTTPALGESLQASGQAVAVTGAPFVSLPITTNLGVFPVTPTQVYNSFGNQVSGLVTSGVFAGLGSGAATLWLLAANEVYLATLASETSAASLISVQLPFTATCMGASGQVLAVGGYVPNYLASGAYAIAVELGGAAIVGFPGSGTANAWFLAGTPELPGVWSLLATTTGLPTYSTGVVAAWANNGNQILLSDYGLGQWTAFSYTAGVLAVQSSGALPGIAPGLAISADSNFALIPNPPAAGFSLLQASGIGWGNAGFAGGAGVAPGASAVVLVSGDAFAVGTSGAVQILAFNAGAWSYSQKIPLSFTPSLGFFDPTVSLVYWANQSNLVSTTWFGSITGIVAQVGVPRQASGVPSSMVVARGQIVLAQPKSASGQLAIYGLTAPATFQLQNVLSTPGVTVIADPLADFSFALATSAQISFWEFEEPYLPVQGTSGVYATVAGGLISPVSGLGQSAVPSALGVGAGGNMLLATYTGGIGLLSAGLAGQTQMLASGGFGAILPASGITWLTTEVQGGLAWVSGL